MRSKIIVLILLSLSSVTFARMHLGVDSQAFNMGVQGGWGGMYTGTLSSETKQKYSENKETLRGFSARLFGGYLWSQDSFRYGVEIGYTYYPKNETTLGSNKEFLDLKYTGYLVDVLGVMKYNFIDSFSVFSKVGGAIVSQKMEAKSKVESKSISKSKYKILPELAIGLGYNFTDQLGVEVIGSYVFGKSSKDLNRKDSLSKISDVATVKTIMVGLIYHFV